MSKQRYLIPVWETVTTAWQNVKGSKGSFWAALGIFFLISFGLGMIEGLVESASVKAGHAISFVCEILIYFLQMGFLFMGIRRAQGSPISFKMLFYVFSHANILIHVILLYLLQLVIILLPIFLMTFCAIFMANAWDSAPYQFTLGLVGCGLLFLLGFIAVIYLTLRMIIAMAFVLDKQSKAWPAVKQSFKATRGNIWRLIGLFLIQLGIFIVAIIPLGIGLIWAIPFGFICYGLIYKRLSSPALAKS